MIVGVVEPKKNSLTFASFALGSPKRKHLAFHQNETSYVCKPVEVSEREIPIMIQGALGKRGVARNKTGVYQAPLDLRAGISALAESLKLRGPHKTGFTNELWEALTSEELHRSTLFPGHEEVVSAQVKSFQDWGKLVPQMLILSQGHTENQRAKGKVVLENYPKEYLADLTLRYEGVTEPEGKKHELITPLTNEAIQIYERLGMPVRALTYVDDNEGAAKLAATLLAEKTSKKSSPMHQMPALVALFANPEKGFKNSEAVIEAGFPSLPPNIQLRIISQSAPVGEKFNKGGYVTALGEIYGRMQVEFLRQHGLMEQEGSVLSYQDLDGMRFGSQQKEIEKIANYYLHNNRYVQVIQN